MIRNNLSKEVLQILLLSSFVSFFLFCFLYFISTFISTLYLQNKGILMTLSQEHNLKFFITFICFFICFIIFICIFLFLFNKKISYLIYIIKYLNNITYPNKNFNIEIKGDNELTLLAKNISQMAIYQKEFYKTKQRLEKENKNLIHCLCHNIKAYLTSILSYCHYLKNKNTLTENELENYINLIQIKTNEINIVMNKFLNEETKQCIIENGNQLIEQLIYDFQKSLDERFDLQIDLSECTMFKCDFNIDDLKSIFENISSNIEKYADPSQKVFMTIKHTDQRLIIVQKNCIKNTTSFKVDSPKIGIKNIERIVNSYKGNVCVVKNDQTFKIKIKLNTLN